MARWALIVLQLEPAPDLEAHFHRVGRTARMGRPGRAVTILSRQNGAECAQFEEVLAAAASERHAGAGGAARALSRPRRIGDSDVRTLRAACACAPPCAHAHTRDGTGRKHFSSSVRLCAGQLPAGLRPAARAAAAAPAARQGPGRRSARAALIPRWRGSGGKYIKNNKISVFITSNVM